MSGPLGLSSALNITEEAINVTKKRGIVSVLGSDSDQSPTTQGSSLSKTLSADMSSKKWLTQNGFSPLKKIAPSLSITDKELQKPCQFDIWSSIISKKPDDDDDSKSLPPPYIHPLVKKSASCLSEKSLQICTESLGSETGSDGFSSYPPSESGDVEEDRKEENQHGVLHQPKTACFDDEDDQPRIVKRSPQYGSFPPPIPSLSRKDGASVRMETHRDNGRLVLEAVSVPLKNNFFAQRQDGRLVLTFANTINEAQVFESFGAEEKGTETITLEEEEEEEEEEMCGHKIESAMNVQKLAAMMNKPVWLSNKNPTWPKTFDEIVKLGQGKEEKVEPTTPPPLVARLIPSASPSPPPSTANAYEYYWRRPNELITPLGQQPPASLLKDKQLILTKKQTANNEQQQQQQLVVLRGNNGDYFVPSLRGCKETRRSLIYLDPYCIATT
ncbi:hypothetical protein V6N12_052556 [Hibiscus sabdariffa]|uniref:FAF domain-containing protein n=1 Tax=Hibiscus sabdariffa TaxID=183260 RepID=A0ABR2C1X9_9ROSI